MKLLKDYLKPEDFQCLEKYHLQREKSKTIHTFELDDDDYDAQPVPLSPIVKELKKQIKKHGADDQVFDKSFRKISMAPGACGANRKKRTIRRNKSKTKKKKQKNKYKRRTYKKNLAGNVVLSFDNITEFYEQDPENATDSHYILETWVIDPASSQPYMVETIKALLSGLSNNKAKFIKLNDMGELTEEEISINKHDFGNQHDINDGIYNAFPLTIVKRKTNDASGRKRRKRRRKRRTGGKRRKSRRRKKQKKQKTRK